MHVGVNFNRTLGTASVPCCPSVAQLTASRRPYTPRPDDGPYAAIAGAPGGLWGKIATVAKHSGFTRNPTAILLLSFEDVKQGEWI
jgi:hypothetical protein